MATVTRCVYCQEPLKQTEDQACTDCLSWSQKRTWEKIQNRAILPTLTQMYEEKFGQKPTRIYHYDMTLKKYNEPPISVMTSTPSSELQDGQNQNSTTPTES